MTQRRKHQRYTVLILLVIFGVFLVSSWEDRMFKNWKSRNLSLFRMYEDIETLCHKDFNIHERFLLDLSVLQNVYLPFENKLFGPVRRSVYLRIVPEIKKTFTLTSNGESGIFIADTGREQKFKFIGKQTFSNMGQLDRNDLSKIRDFMAQHNIKYYIIDVISAQWTAKKKVFTGYGFSWVYNNPDFMLLKVLK